jgi:hypothetical protein
VKLTVEKLDADYLSPAWIPWSWNAKPLATAETAVASPMLPVKSKIAGINMENAYQSMPVNKRVR